MEKKTIGIAITGSFCTFDKMTGVIKTLTASGMRVIPIFSENVQHMDTRFGKAEDFRKKICEITGEQVIDTIAKAEPIGPKSSLDALVIAPCTGNTIAKLAAGITDTPVLMAAKAHLRNEKPLVISISTNDALGMNFKNIGTLMNIKNIYFVGCGGSLGALYPAKTFVERESQVLRSAWINSNEFVHSTPKDFGENSIICLACHKGNTPETIKAARLGKEKGAAVIILTWLEESEIIEFGDYIIHYTFDASPDHLAGDIDYAGEKTQCALLVAVELVAQTEGYANYDKFYEALGMISNIIRNARTHVAARAEAFAEEYQNDSVIYTMGSGAAYGAAYMESICIFMEMQWLDSSSIHTGEFFHGPFEVTDANRPFMIQISEGSTRELDERALTFLKTYAKRIEVLDAKELGLSTIDASVVDYFNHALFNNVYPIYNHALAVKREHPLTTRRYMWKVEY